MWAVWDVTTGLLVRDACKMLSWAGAGCVAAAGADVGDAIITMCTEANAPSDRFGGVWTAAVSGEGSNLKLLIGHARNEDGFARARLWDLSTGRQIGQDFVTDVLPPSRFSVVGVLSVAVNNELIVMGAADRKVYVFNHLGVLIETLVEPPPVTIPQPKKNLYKENSTNGTIGTNGANTNTNVNVNGANDSQPAQAKPHVSKGTVTSVALDSGVGGRGRSRTTRVLAAWCSGGSYDTPLATVASYKLESEGGAYGDAVQASLELEKVFTSLDLEKVRSIWTLRIICTCYRRRGPLARLTHPKARPQSQPTCRPTWSTCTLPSPSIYQWYHQSPHLRPASGTSSRSSR